MRKRMIVALISTLGVLCIPLIAMQFTNEVNWTFIDFIVAGILMFSFITGISLLIKSIKNKKRLIFYIIALILIFIMLWVELAVGIFNSPLAGS